MSLIDKLKQLEAAVVGVAGVATGAVPIVNGVIGLAGLLEAVAADLKSVPVDPVTGKPMTIEAASAHLDMATTRSKVQDDQIRANAAAALAENQAEADAAAGKKE